MEFKDMKIIIALFLIVGNCVAANHYIRPGASGNGNGSDWTNACTEFTSACDIASLVRGDTYYIADGTYASRTFNQAASGTSVITIKKATANDHGTETGWNSEYGNGSATFPAVSFSSNYWYARGFKVTGEVAVGTNPISTSHVTLEGFTARNMFLRADYVSIIGGSVGGFNSCDAGMPEDGIQLWSDSTRGANGITIDGVYVHDIRRTGGCSRHSDGLQIYSGTNHTIKNSVFVNMPTESIIARPGVGPLSNITIENNFFGPILDGTQAINIGTAPDYCSNILVRHNTVANGVSTFDCVTPTGGPGSRVVGNIIKVGSTDAATFSDNVFVTGSSVVGINAKQCSPTFFNAAGFDYHLANGDVCAKDRGSSSFPATDIDGQTRPPGSAVDAGADEYEPIVSQLPQPPTALQVVVR
jgi:hypothetical protein